MMMKNDPVIERIREARRRIEEKCDHDVEKLIMHYIQLEKRHPERFIDLQKMREEQLKAS